MNKKLKALEKEIEQIVKRIIISAKLDKQYSNEDFSELYLKLGEYKIEIKDAVVMNRPFVAKMFYLFSTLVLYAKYIDYEPKVMDEIYRLRTNLLSMLDDGIL
jgi:hypothetical protein